MKYLTFLLIMLLGLSSCNIINRKRIVGNGTITTKSYDDLKNFRLIDASSNVVVYLKQDSVFSVKLETDENLVKYLNIKVSSGELDIYCKENVSLRPTDEIKVFVSMPELNGIDVSGASSVKTVGRFTQDIEMKVEASGASEGEMEIRAPRLSLNASGASTISISGETKDVKAEASGASSIKAFDLKAENVNADASGASKAQVFASISLIADASGASSVSYRGNPKVTSDVSGAGSIKKAE